MGISGNKDSQLASIRILNDFTDEVLPISAGSLSRNGTANAESVLAKTDITSRMVELISVAA